jgi:hypothetical protein
MANPIGLASPEAEEKERNMERHRNQKDEISVRQCINFSPFKNMKGSL